MNEGPDRFHFTGVQADVAERADLIARVGTDAEVVLTSFPIPAGAALDLTTSHLRLELHPLRRDLATGETFIAVLNFVQWQIEVPIHVHEPNTRS